MEGNGVFMCTHLSNFLLRSIKLSICKCEYPLGHIHLPLTSECAFQEHSCESPIHRLTERPGCWVFTLPATYNRPKSSFPEHRTHVLASIGSSPLLVQFQSEHNSKSQALFLRLNSSQMNHMRQNKTKWSRPKPKRWLDLSPMATSG